jgi:hypothetical protein
MAGWVGRSKEERIMGYQQKLRGLVLSTGLLTAALMGAIPAWAADYKQAPMLDEQVKAGKLPTVNERLPEHPYVETMVDGVGKYGGTLRTTILANGDQYNLTRTIANELHLLRDEVERVVCQPRHRRRAAGRDQGSDGGL